ncbi:MAG: amino-acid racemase [Pseudonocardia sp.]|jgi:predicted amino acid racemase|uniref:alanine racemase n=1 Tax=Pseudonocardia sp. TaxID=60912 RepID=UPI002612C17A|nr:alanine racemase [Pseudonocardia sp.]MCU1625471.1 amino-acid racemase [Pseudonocardia sp.]
MFLDLLRRRNPALVDAAIAAHQSGELPANTFAIDLDAVTANAAAISAEAARLGLTPLAMTKQMGRNPDYCRAIMAGGIAASVAVDTECARATVRAGMQLGHIGHLVQVPRAEARAAADMRPANWTVFNEEKAREAAEASAASGREQPLLARIKASGDEFYSGHEGGFDADDVLALADGLDALDSARFAGITTFPALLFDPQTRAVRATRNLATLETAAKRLTDSGRTGVQINGPGTTSSAALVALAGAGVTQVEPGHALTGTTPWHAVQDLPELPAACYVSEVSHLHDGRAYCFGGGMYVDPVFPPYQVRAVVGREPGATALLPATLPPPTAIDYYGQLDLADAPTVSVGDSVVFGFRAQAFVTRAYTAGIAGIASGRPRVAGIYSADGSKTSWPA